MSAYKITIGVLFALFLLANGAYLHRVPGLLGDEGSEGENVYELVSREGITVVGERSYIGPAIDYLRVPFVWAFGYTALALRALLLIFNIATFALAASVLRRSFGDTPGLFALTAFAFSPVFLLYGRLGWAITLYPFFGFLIIYFLQRPWKTKWLWAGLAAGLGLANHIVFFPIVVGIGAGTIIFLALSLFVKSDKEAGVLLRLHPRPTASRSAAGARRGTPAASPLSPRSLFAIAPEWVKRILTAMALLIVGFWAGFGMQFAVLQLKTDDQGDPSQTTQLFSERVSDAISALPLYLSGSSFAARYTGVEFAPGFQLAVTAIILLLGVVAIALNWKKPAAWAWGIGLQILLLATLYMVDRFTLRYFMTYAMGMWLFAGLGFGSVLQKLQVTPPGAVANYRLQITAAFSALLAIGLTGWMTLAVLIPFLQTGGSTADFGLGNRTDSAAAFVDIRPLIACLEGRGALFSESVHIWNRLQYLSHSDGKLNVVPEDGKSRATIFIEYRTKDMAQPGDICPELAYFRVRNI